MIDEAFHRSYENLLLESRGDALRAACLTPEQLVDLVELRAPEGERLAWFQHVLACEHCLREYEMLRSLRRGAIDLARRRTRRFAIYGAVIALAAGAIGFMSLRGTRAPAVRLVAPAGLGTEAHPLILRWHPVDGSLEYRVEVTQPSGAPVYTMTTRDTMIVVNPATPFDPTVRYEWMVRARMPGGEERRSEREVFTLGAP